MALVETLKKLSPSLYRLRLFVFISAGIVIAISTYYFLYVRSQTRYFNGLCPKSGLDLDGGVHSAPEEQHVYSPSVLITKRSSGAPCALSASIYMPLLRSGTRRDDLRL